MNQQYLDGVSGRIATSILSFNETIGNREFYADDLRNWVNVRAGQCAPGSADRILRDLRKRKLLDYTVLNRAKSLYCFNPTKQPRLF